MQSENNLGTLRRRAWVVVLFTLLGVALGAIPKPTKAKDSTLTYTATHTLLVASSTGNLYSDPLQLNQIQLFASTGEVPQRVATRLKVDIGAVGVTPSLDQATGALRLTADRSDPKTAELIADTVAEELSSFIVERQDAQLEVRRAANLERQTDLTSKIRDLEAQSLRTPGDNVVGAKLDALRAQLSVVFQRGDELSIDNGTISMTTLEKAHAMAVSSQGLQAPRSRSTRGALGAVVGGIIGVGLAMLLGRLDRRVRTREQAEAAVGLRAQVTVPSAPQASLTGLVVTPSRHDSLSDSFRALRTVVAFAEGGKAKEQGRAPVVVVVSAGPGEGKTSVSANLAAAFMESGSRTIAVNTDFRRPALATRILGMPLPSLNVSYQEALTVRPEQLVCRTLNPNLAMVDLSSIKAPPGDLTRLTMRLMTTMTAVSDVVVVDTSPIAVTAEVLELIPLADVVILVVRIDQTSTAAVTRAIATLRSLEPTNLLLAVVGDATEKSTYYDYGYGDKSEGTKVGRLWKRKH